MENEQSILRNGQWLTFRSGPDVGYESVKIIDGFQLLDLSYEFEDLMSGFGFSDYMKFCEYESVKNKDCYGRSYLVFLNESSLGDNTIESIHAALEMIAPELGVDVAVRMTGREANVNGGFSKICFDVEFFHSYEPEAA